MAKKPSKRQINKAVKTVKKLPTWVIVVAVVLVIAIVGVTIYGLWTFDWDAKALLTHLGLITEDPIIPSGDVSIHYLELGNGSSGDCIYIKVGEYDILIDGGSKDSSFDTIKNYLATQITDGTIEYCIVTHAHADHYACYAKSGENLFDLYKYEVLIDFPLTNQALETSNGNKTQYGRYVDNRAEEIATDGTIHYTALQCYNNEDGATRSISLGENISLEILNNPYYTQTTTNENNYSVCCMLKQGSKQFLFTGDLEDEGEDQLVTLNDLGQVTVYKAGHHGSKTSSRQPLLSTIRPQYCIVQCVAGDKYGFPTQQFINYIAVYTDEVYITSQDNGEDEGNTPVCGTIIVNSSADGITINGTTATVKLKDTEWFKQNRTCPTEWAA